MAPAGYFCCVLAGFGLGFSVLFGDHLVEEAAFVRERGEHAAGAFDRRATSLHRELRRRRRDFECKGHDRILARETESWNCRQAARKQFGPLKKTKAKGKHH
jgi:hypothetical protein